jgi:hypothetical protein
MILNLNNEVLVKLTEYGKDVYWRYWPYLQGDDALAALLARQDAEGYVPMLLWQVMHVFGDSMYMGGQQPLEMTIIVPDPSGPQEYFL